ncbi:hypothetical protein [Amycolatopsis sp. NPDC058986]|uniref:hypothetical protein n=1 Tax=unclassified Amycolatopsis TaxID=2618356 RepID=UPI00366A9FA2
MSTHAIFVIGRDGTWLGALYRDSYPEGIAAVGPGLLALTATDPDTYRTAVNDLLAVWEDDERGHAVQPQHRNEPPPFYYDTAYVYAFDGTRVHIRTPDHTWILATDHPDVQTALHRK